MGGGGGGGGGDGRIIHELVLKEIVNIVAVHTHHLCMREIKFNNFKFRETKA